MCDYTIAPTGVSRCWLMPQRIDRYCTRIHEECVESRLSYLNKYLRRTLGVRMGDGDSEHKVRDRIVRKWQSGGA